MPSARFLSATLTALVLATSVACSSSEPARTDVREDVETFLHDYARQFRPLYIASQEAEWASNTRIVEGNDRNLVRTRAANEALAAFTGSTENIEAARGFLAHRRDLTPVEVKQIESVLFKAGENPAIVAHLVRQKIGVEAAQTQKLYGFEYHLDGATVSTNEIDELLRTEKNLDKRRAVWEASKEVGPVLRDGLVQLRSLRNATVRSVGYRDFFAYMASEYGMSTEEMAGKVAEINEELRPLFRELHTWARYELAKRYNQPVPDLIPAHWLPNRWGQDWAAIVDLPGYDIDGALAEKSPEWLVQQAQRFYVSLGFPELPESFWQKSSLYPVTKDAGFKKNNHATAWHIDLDHDVRSLMSVEPSTQWYETTHHELGHVYYYLAYSRPEVPLLLRDGACRAFHEAIGSLMGLAAMQPRFIAEVGLASGAPAPDPMQVLLKQALQYVVFIPWSAGTMFRFEKELYADELAPSRWNARWWELAAKYQGIEPPAPRLEKWCDAATKTHINDDPASYYDYALSYVLLFQLHDHIARKILREDPRDSNYYGRRDVGEFLREILAPGASVDWRAMLAEKTGEDLSARAMLQYFDPLKKWLVEQNKGRKHTLEGP